MTTAPLLTVVEIYNAALQIGTKSLPPEVGKPLFALLLALDPVAKEADRGQQLVLDAYAAGAPDPARQATVDAALEALFARATPLPEPLAVFEAELLLERGAPARSVLQLGPYLRPAAPR